MKGGFRLSHYSVCVFSHSGTECELDSLLAPYSENVEPGSPYAVFEPNTDSDVDPTTNQPGYWYNPDARWDWWCVGGRFEGFRLLPEAAKRLGYDFDCEALVSDIDFSDDKQAYDEALSFWDHYVDGKPSEDGEDHSSFWKPEYYRERYGSRELFARSRASQKPYAFVTADGEWVGDGVVGWFAVDDATDKSITESLDRWEKYLAEAIEQGLHATMIDCHI